MLANHLHRATVGEVTGHRRPRATEVGAAHDVWLEVVAAMTVEGGVQRAFAVRGELHAAHERGVGHAGKAGGLGPRLAVVLRDLNEPVVGADGQQAGAARRLGHGGDVAELGRAFVQTEHITRRHGAPHRQAVAINVTREVGADRGPRVAAVGALEQVVRRHVHRASGVLRRYDRRTPVPAMPLAILRIRLDALGLSAARVVAHHAAVLRLGVRDVVVERIGHVVEAVAACHAIPVGVGRTEGVAGATRAGPRLIVLQSAVHVVERRGVVDGDGVELRADDVFHVVPAAAAIVRNVYATVVAQHDVFAVFGIDPEGVCITVHATTAGEADPRFATVVRLLRARIQTIHVFGVGGIAAHLAVVPRRAVAAVHQLPRAAGVIAAIEAVGGRLRVHRGIHRAGARAAHRETDAADLTSG